MSTEATVEVVDVDHTNAVDVEYGLNGFVQGSGTTVQISAGDSIITLTGLTAQTTYDVYVRNNCGEGDVSGWLSKQSFTTMCAADNVTASNPFVEDFESYSSEDVDQAKGHHGHDGRRDAYAQEDGRDGLLQPHVQHRRHQGTRPGAGPRQRNGHQDAKTDGAVLAHYPAFQVGFFLQPGDLLIPPLAAFAQPGKNVSDIDDDEWYRHPIAQYCRRQGHRIIQPQGNAVRQAAPQLDDRGHGNKECGNKLAKGC